MSATTLLEREVQYLLSWLPEAGAPVDSDDSLDRVLLEGPVVAGSPEFAPLPQTPSVLVTAMLAELREVDRDLLAPKHIVRGVVKLVDLVPQNSHHWVERGIAAVMHEGKDGVITLPLGAPLDKSLFYLLAGSPVDDQVRLLAELIRLLGDAVRLLSLPDSARGHVVRGLRQLVGLARTLLSTQPEDQAPETDERGNDHPDALPPVHGASVSGGNL